MQKLISIFLFLLLAGCQTQITTTPTRQAVTTEPEFTEAPATPTTASVEQTSTPAIPKSTLFPYDWDDPEPFRAGLTPAGQAGLEILPGASVYHMYLSVSDDLSMVSGQVEVRYENRESIPLDEIQFRLFPNILGGKMQIASTLVNGKAVTPGYDLEDSVLRVPITPKLAPGQQAVISLSFGTRVPKNTRLNYGVLANADGVLAYAHGYPMIAVYNAEGWNTEIPPQYGDVTFNDASFYIVTIDAPKELILVAAGSEINREEKDGRQVVTYADGPARDFNFAASKDFTKLSETTNGITITSYAPGSYDRAARRAVDSAVRALEIFSERYAPYPYTELDIVTTPNEALGIEYPGFIAMTDYIMNPDPEMGQSQANIYIESVMAHEAAHQWFYNLVGDDQLDEPWLDESLSQFVTLQYYIDSYGEAGARGFENSLEDRWASVEYEKIPVGMPVRNYSEKEYSAIVYGRGGLFFEELRDQMGLAAFDAFMKDYTETYSWKIATTADLKNMAEKHCNCDLTPLFEKWIYEK